MQSESEEYTGQWLNAEMTCDCCGNNWKVQMFLP